MPRAPNDATCEHQDGRTLTIAAAVPALAAVVEVKSEEGRASEQVRETREGTKQGQPGHRGTRTDMSL
jgi:hypothetical protein